MIHLFLNALAASAGAGLTYVRNVVPQFAARRDMQATFLVSPELRREFADYSNVKFLTLESSGAAHRFWREQSLLPRLIGQVNADVLISTGNFALRKSPVPQILLSGNSLYTSADFYRDLRARGAWGIWFDTHVKAMFAKCSIRWADCTVAPSRAFAATLQAWTGREVLSIYHGFDRAGFFGSTEALPPEINAQLKGPDSALRLLFVSHYNYYRNFETLLRAIPLLRQQLRGKPIRLFLTCKLERKANPGSYEAAGAQALVRNLGIENEVIELGTVPYHLLHHVYGAADVYVTPAYTETFAHPLVEAMACKMPIVAADIPVHREVCDGSALFFDRFSPSDLAEAVLAIAQSPDLAGNLSERGFVRSQDFSWQRHADELIGLARGLVNRH
jgi:glycosyltransferase involved in cell wall biosynthesis